jgi:hypothetical protein
MTEPELTSTRGKSGKSKTVFKRSKSEPEVSSRERQESGRSSSSEPRQDERTRATDPRPEEAGGEDPAIIARIQQRAYWLYEASGFEHGHDLEHWLEAERQVTGSSRTRSDQAREQT